MMKLNTGIFPEKAAGLITNLLIFLGREKSYCITQGKRKHKNFKNNKLTSSKNRWDLWEEKILSEYPEVISGGATNRWINESLKACKNALNNRHKIKVPMLVLQAENDDIVKKEGIDVLCETTDCKKVIFTDSKHEIFMEKDSIRDLALQQVLDFINQGRSKDKAKTF
jgi:lysophospholipase